MSIVVVGSVAFDSIETPKGKRDMALGGSANFFSVAASHLSKVQLVAVVGDDFPQAHVDWLQERGIGTEGLTRAEGKTFHWKGLYGEDLNEAQTLATDLNVFADFEPVLPGSYKEASTVFLANIDPDLQRNVLEQVDNPNLVALDTMNFWIEGKLDALKKTLAGVDLLFVNDTEAKMLGAADNVVTAAHNIQEMGPKIVVIKRGEYGAMLFHQNDIAFCPAYPLDEVFDPTGAGDTFAGGFLGWLDKVGDINSQTLREALAVGTVLASFVCEDFSFDKTKQIGLTDLHERVRALQKITAIPENINIL